MDILTGMRRPLRPPPEPLQVDAVRVVAWGTALWAVAVIVLVIFSARLAESGDLIWLWSAVSGLLLGLLGLRLCILRRRQDRRERD